MRSQALLLEAHHTTHIEGTHLTLEQAARLFAGQAVPEADPEDARHGKMTIQDYEALCPKAHRRSLQRDLQGLVKAGFVAASGATNLLEYRLL